MFTKAMTPDPRLARYDHLIVHVTATHPGQDFDDHDIERIHKNMGFSSCGYNALIKRDGAWLDSDSGAVTRPIGAQGAHVGGCGAGWNGRSFGVSLVGGVDRFDRPEFNMTDSQMATLEKGIRRFISIHPKGRSGVTIMGHRDLIKKTNAPGKKACPCFDVVPWWDSVSGGFAGADVDEDAHGYSSAVDRPRFWTVASGDTLSGVIKTTGVSLSEILAFNPEIEDPNLIAVGQIIKLD